MLAVPPGKTWLRHTVIDSSGLMISEGKFRVSKMTIILEFNDAKQNGEWVVEFCLREGVGKAPREWKRLLGEWYKFDFETANTILCALVRTDMLLIKEKREGRTGKRWLSNHDQDNQYTERGVVDGEMQMFTLQFESGSTHYRIRNTTTEEVLVGDAL